MPDRSARTSGDALVAVRACASSATRSQPTRACSARSGSPVTTRCAFAGPNPQASTAGATVTSNAPPVAALTSRARANTANVSSDSANGARDACALKRESSLASSYVDIRATTLANAASMRCRAAVGGLRGERSRPASLADHVEPMVSPPNRATAGAPRVDEVRSPHPAASAAAPST